jgi:hypothetical protein
MRCDGTIRQATARMRWPNYDVQEDGRWAVVLHCCQKVILTDSYLEAQQIFANSCLPDLCSHVALGPSHKMHAIVELIPRPRIQPDAGVDLSSLGWGE